MFCDKMGAMNMWGVVRWAKDHFWLGERMRVLWDSRGIQHNSNQNKVEKFI